jgi:hypothetical protein
MAVIDPIGGLYTSSRAEQVPNASAVHTVISNPNGGWLYSGNILCLFREPIIVIDRWRHELYSKTNRKKSINYYIALYQDVTIAIPVEWIDNGDVYHKVEKDGI